MADNPNGERSRRNGVGGKVFIVTIVVLALGSCVAMVHSCNQGARESAAADAKDTAADKANCDQDAATAFISTQAVGNITPDFTSDAGGLILVVNPVPWRAIGYFGQQRVLAGYDCALAGPGHHWRSIRVREYRDGPDLMKIGGGQLMDWRKMGLAPKPEGNNPAD